MVTTHTSGSAFVGVRNPPCVRSFIRLTAAILLLAAIAVLPVRAQQAAAEPPNPLKTVKSLKCAFPVATTGVWKEGVPLPAQRTQEMTFEIKEIDATDGTAEYYGTAGRSFVSAVLSGWSLYFVESSVGQLNVTTVFAQETTAKKLKAVHSRHGYLQMQIGKFIAEPSVSQSYGECEIVS